MLIHFQTQSKSRNDSPSLPPRAHGGTSTKPTTRTRNKRPNGIAGAREDPRSKQGPQRRVHPRPIFVTTSRPCDDDKRMKPSTCLRTYQDDLDLSAPCPLPPWQTADSARLGRHGTLPISFRFLRFRDNMRRDISSIGGPAFMLCHGFQDQIVPGFVE
jgi:hypothetical protein